MIVYYSFLFPFLANKAYPLLNILHHFHPYFYNKYFYYQNSKNLVNIYSYIPIDFLVKENYNSEFYLENLYYYYPLMLLFDPPHHPFDFYSGVAFCHLYYHTVLNH